MMDVFSRHRLHLINNSSCQRCNFPTISNFLKNTIAFSFTLSDNEAKNIKEQECIPVGCVPSAVVAISGGGGGVCPGGYLPGGECLPGGCLPGGGVCQTPP